MKAMILAAGRGERMRPLTDQTPKPLLKVGQETLIGRNIRLLAEAGIQDIVINVSYLGNQLKTQLGDGANWGVSIEYSVEDTPLGPGGGIVKALPLLGDGSFILLGADIWHNYPLSRCTEHTDSPAHLVLVNNPDFHPAGDFGLRNNQLTTNKPKLTYGCISVWQTGVFADGTLNKACGIRPFIDPLIKQQRATGEHFLGAWYNVGTPTQLKYLNDHV